jgi:hypothetical protein
MSGTHHSVLKDVVLEYFGHWQRHTYHRSRGETDKADDALDDMQLMERGIVVIDQRPKDAQPRKTVRR